MAARKRRTTKRLSKRGRQARGTGKRETVTNKAGTFYGRRTGAGRFREMDERGRSLKTDRGRKAKTTAKRGRGDRGDRR